MKISKREIIFFLLAIISLVIAVTAFFLHQTELSCYYMIASIICFLTNDIFELKRKYNELEDFFYKYKKEDNNRWKILFDLLKTATINNENKSDK